MKMMKKSMASFLIILILIGSLFTSVSYGAESTLNDAQREAIVNTAVKLIEEGNKNRILRYSQGHRYVGYNGNTVTSSSKQQTSGYTTVSDSGLIGTLKSIVATSAGIEVADVRLGSQRYFCHYLGHDIQGTVPFDCSSLTSAFYNMTVGTPFTSAWTTHVYRSQPAGQQFYKKISASEIKPGDLILTTGHIVMYLGDYNNSGQAYIAQASGFANTSKNKYDIQRRLVEWFKQNPTAIKGHPAYSAKTPVIQLTDDEIMDATKQLNIKVYRPNSSATILTYVGPIGEGRVGIDFGALGEWSGTEGGTGDSPGTAYNGPTHGTITLPGNVVREWPEELTLADQTLKSSTGYFYKGTPSYGQYEGHINVYDWFIKEVPNMLDWLIGFTTSGFKAVLIGWTAILEDVTSSVLNFGYTADTVGQVKLLVDGVNKITPSTLAYRESGVVLADNEGTPNVDEDDPVDTSDGKNRYNVEDVIFNRVPILDINFFDMEKAGGEELQEDSFIHNFRVGLAGWYNVLRAVAIIAMLVVLIYNAIRMIIAVPDQKASYKEKLIDWLIGFIIVFSIHFFMLGIIWLNATIVTTLDPVALEATTVDTPEVNTNQDISELAASQTSLFEAIRIQSYDIQATTGFAAAIMYLVLVVLMIRFVVLYVKRLFVLALLTVVSPVMGVLYAMNRGKYPISNWMREYAYNVLIQFVHVIIYTVILGAAFGMTQIETFLGSFLAIMALGFMMPAEKLTKKIFGFDKENSSNGDLGTSTLQDLAIYKTGRAVIKKGPAYVKKVAPTVTKYSQKYDNYLQSNATKQSIAPISSATGNTTGNSTRNSSNNVDGSGNVEDNGKDFTPMGEKLPKWMPDWVKNNVPEYYRDKDGVPIARSYDRNMYLPASGVDKELMEAKKERAEARYAYAKQSVLDVANVISGSASIFAAIPLLVLDTKSGIGLGAFGISRLSNAASRQIRGPKKSETKSKFTSKKLIFGFAKTTAAVATLGASVGVMNMINNTRDKMEKLENLELYYTDQVELLEQAKILEEEIAREILKIQSKIAFDVNMNSDTELNAIKNEELLKSSRKENEELIKANKKLANFAEELDKKDFEQALRVAVNNLKEKDVEKIVLEYIEENKVEKFSTRDLTNITDRINNKLISTNAGVSLSSQFSDSVRADLTRKIGTVTSYKVARQKEEEKEQNRKDLRRISTKQIDHRELDNIDRNDYIVEKIAEKPHEVDLNKTVNKATEQASINRQIEKQDELVTSIINNMQEKDIEVIVQKYMERNDAKDIRRVDLDKIMDIINDELVMKNMDEPMTRQFVYNLRLEMEKRINVVADKIIENNTKNDLVHMLNKAVEQEVTNRKKQDKRAHLSVKTHDELRDELDRKNISVATNNLNKKEHINSSKFTHIETKDIDNEALDKKAIDEKIIMNVVKNSTKEEIVEIINAALKKEGIYDTEVTNEKYKGLTNSVKKLSNVAKQYKDRTGRDMYMEYDESGNVTKDEAGNFRSYSVHQVVSSMRNHIKYLDRPHLRY